MEVNYRITLGLIPVALIAILLVVIGYWLGNMKSKKLIRQLGRMEKKIMDLNSELLYGPGTSAK